MSFDFCLLTMPIVFQNMNSDAQAYSNLSYVIDRDVFFHKSQGHLCLARAQL